MTGLPFMIRPVWPVLGWAKTIWPSSPESFLMYCPIRRGAAMAPSGRRRATDPLGRPLTPTARKSPRGSRHEAQASIIAGLPALR
jgi:hypothetical protein